MVHTISSPVRPLATEGPAGTADMQGREILFEFQRVGNFVKVTAIDAETGVEASIQGPANAAEVLLRSNAKRRLEFVMRRKGFIP